MKELYRKLYEKQAAFYRKRPALIALLKALNGITLVAVAAAYLALCLYALVFVEPRFEKEALWRVVGVPALCLAAVSFLRGVVKRKRPYENGIVPLYGKNGYGNSFPSRHVASAFVIGTTMIAYMPPLGVAILLVGGLIGYIRFTVGWHYPSDLLAGAALGAACGLLVFL